MNIDMLSLSAHKFHGPKGVGALVLADGAREMGCAGPAELPRRLWGLQAALFRGERSEAFRMDALAVLARSVNPERLSNNPAALEEETLRALYARILAGQPPRSC